MKTMTKIVYATLALLGVGCFELLPKVQAVVPPPDGGYPGFTTAEGTNALKNLTAGLGNTANGWYSLFTNSTGSYNVGVGAGTLALSNGDQNTAVGVGALLLNNGSLNTATGALALLNNSNGNFNTAVGCFGLQSNQTGDDNTAVGIGALSSNISGSHNTAVGDYALYSNTADFNTAIGHFALADNVSGQFDTAIGTFALRHTTADGNTAVGHSALLQNTTGIRNNAFGQNALSANVGGQGNNAFGFGTLSLSGDAGSFNTAIGDFALASNNGAPDNTAVGHAALDVNTTGHGNTAIGALALQGSNTGGHYNIAVGYAAGQSITGNDNIDIGNTGEPGENATIRIGDETIHTATYIAGINGATLGVGAQVYIDPTGQLGTMVSSRRFKKEIKPMDKASKAILALKPVTFHYKSDKTNTRQFGLVAEEVAEVNPDLVVRDKNGEIYTVRYDAVNAMLLNEFLKAHKKLEAQQTTIAELKSTIAHQERRFAQQEEQIAALTSGLQKVNAQLEMRKDAPRAVADR
jgi:uncharacterized coiled-coil protein SlyX